MENYLSFNSEEVKLLNSLVCIFHLFPFLFKDIETRIILLYFISTPVSLLLREGKGREWKGREGKGKAQAQGGKSQSYPAGFWIVKYCTRRTGNSATKTAIVSSICFENES